jgi:hypothetical protein
MDHGMLRWDATTSTLTFGVLLLALAEAVV